MQIVDLIIPFIVSFTISLVLTPIVRYFAIRFGFVDNPNRSHPAILHTTIIPRAGGIAMLIAFVLTSLWYATVDVTLLAIIFSSTIMVTIGTIDDKYDLSPKFRLLIQLFCGLIVALSGIEFYISNPLGGDVINFNSIKLIIPLMGISIPLITILIIPFWTTMFMNISNWTKGASQLPGIAVIAFLTLAGVALKYQAGNPLQEQTAILAVILAGAVLAFVPFNFPPEKMFPGFGASTFIGLNLAVLSILSGGKVAALLIVFIIPVIDAFVVGVKRLIKGKNPLTHDREHLYHLLMDFGLTKRNIIVIYWLTTIIFSLSTILITGNNKLIIICGLGFLITLIFLILYKKKNV